MTEVHRPGTGAIFGIVTEDSVVKVGSPVYLYDARRWAGVAQKRLLGVQLTRPDGGFVFNGLNVQYKDYVLSATDEDGEVPKNALIQDRVQPIPAHQGATWFTNWWAEALSDGAYSVIAAYPVMGDETRWRIGGLTNEIINHNQTADPTLLSLTPGAPQMAGMQLAGGYLALSSIVVAPMSIANEALSIEWVIDLDSIESGTPTCYTFNSTASVGSSGTDSVTAFDISKFVSRIVLRINDGGSSVSIYAWTLDNDGTSLTNTNSQYNTHVLSASLAQYSGVVHIVATYRHGSRCNIFVDGVSIAQTTSPPAFPRQFNMGMQRSCWVIVGNWSDAVTGATYKTGPAATYMRALEDEEVLAHYEALMTEDVLPNRSGYQKAVMSLHPQIYFRLNEPVIDVENHAWPLVDSEKAQGLGLRAGKLVTQVVGAVSPAQNSPVVGGNAMAFTGADRLRCDAGIWMHASPDEVSFSCWVKFDQATPGSTETLLRQNIPISSTSYFLVRRNTDGHLQVTTRRGGTHYTDTFTTYIPPADTWLQVFIRVDLSDVEDPYMELWVGTENDAPELKERLGVGVGVLFSPGATSFIMPRMDTNPRYSRLEMAENLVGSLCEVAIYAQKITEDDMLAIWQAKDVV